MRDRSIDWQSGILLVATIANCILVVAQKDAIFILPSVVLLAVFNFLQQRTSISLYRQELSKLDKQNYHNLQYLQKQISSLETKLDGYPSAADRQSRHEAIDTELTSLLDCYEEIASEFQRMAERHKEFARFVQKHQNFEAEINRLLHNLESQFNIVMQRLEYIHENTSTDSQNLIVRTHQIEQKIAFLQSTQS
jgi:chromosome segregation ATPase